MTPLQADLPRHAIIPPSLHPQHERSDPASPPTQDYTPVSQAVRKEATQRSVTILVPSLQKGTNPALRTTKWQRKMQPEICMDLLSQSEQARSGDGPNRKTKTIVTRAFSRWPEPVDAVPLVKSHEPKEMQQKSNRLPHTFRKMRSRRVKKKSGLLVELEVSWYGNKERNF